MAVKASRKKHGSREGTPRKQNRPHAGGHQYCPVDGRNDTVFSQEIGEDGRAYILAIGRPEGARELQAIDRPHPINPRVQDLPKAWYEAVTFDMQADDMMREANVAKILRVKGKPGEVADKLAKHSADCCELENHFINELQALGFDLYHDICVAEKHEEILNLVRSWITDERYEEFRENCYDYGYIQSGGWIEKVDRKTTEDPESGKGKRAVDLAFYLLKEVGHRMRKHRNKVVTLSTIRYMEEAIKRGDTVAIGYFREATNVFVVIRYLIPAYFGARQASPYQYREVVRRGLYPGPFDRENADRHMENVNGRWQFNADVRRAFSRLDLQGLVAAGFNISEDGELRVIPKDWIDNRELAKWRDADIAENQKNLAAWTQEATTPATSKDAGYALKKEQEMVPA